MTWTRWAGWVRWGARERSGAGLVGVVGCSMIKFGLGIESTSAGPTRFLRLATGFLPRHGACQETSLGGPDRGDWADRFLFGLFSEVENGSGREKQPHFLDLLQPWAWGSCPESVGPTECRQAARLPSGMGMDPSGLASQSRVVPFTFFRIGWGIPGRAVPFPDPLLVRGPTPFGALE
jgi:hypothetical protein